MDATAAYVCVLGCCFTEVLIQNKLQCEVWCINQASIFLLLFLNCIFGKILYLKKKRVFDQFWIFEKTSII